MDPDFPWKRHVNMKNLRGEPTLIGIFSQRSLNLFYLDPK